MAHDLFLSPCKTVVFFLHMKTMSSSLSSLFHDNNWSEITWEEKPAGATRAMLLRHPKFRLISAQSEAVKTQNILDSDQIKELNRQGVFLIDGHSNTAFNLRVIKSIVENNIIIIPYLEFGDHLQYNNAYTLKLLDLFFKEFNLNLSADQIPLINKNQDNYINNPSILDSNIYSDATVFNLDSIIFDTVFSKINLYKLTPEYIANEAKRREARGTRRTYLQDLSFYDVYPRQILDDYKRLFRFIVTGSDS